MRENIQVSEKFPATRFLFVHLLNAAVLSALLFAPVSLYLRLGDKTLGVGMVLLSSVLSGLMAYLLFKIRCLLYYRLLAWFSLERRIRLLASALLGSLAGPGGGRTSGACVRVSSRATGTSVECSLDNADFREKVMFRNVMAELLSPIDNPRYLLVCRERILGFPVLDCGKSLACPSLLGGTKKDALAIQRHLRKLHAPYRLIYTRNEKGASLLRKCRRKS